MCELALIVTHTPYFFMGYHDITRLLPTSQHTPYSASSRKKGNELAPLILSTTESEPPKSACNMQSNLEGGLGAGPNGGAMHATMVQGSACFGRRAPATCHPHPDGPRKLGDKDPKDSNS